MAANYSRLWKLLIDRNLNKTSLRELAGISTGTLAKLGKTSMSQPKCWTKYALR